MEIIEFYVFLALYISSSALKSAHGENCDPPPFVKNGFIFGMHLKKYSEGSKVTYGCPESYEMSGNEDSVCSNGIWTQVPQCVQSSGCGDPPAVSHASLDNHDEREAIYSCNKGNEFTGSSRARCSDGQWTDIPICSRSGCGDPPAVSHASLDNHDEKEAIYSCNKGYEFTGSSRARCSDGQWTDIPICSRASCGDPKAIENGIVISQSSDNTEVTYQCQPGYILTGSPKVTCHDGQWADRPRCSRQDCGSPPKINYGDIVTSDEMKATYQCNRFYTLRGSATITCRNGQWGSPPTCFGPCEVKTIPATYNLQSPQQTVFIAEGQSERLQCKPGTYHYTRRSYYGVGSCFDGKVIYSGCTYYN